MSKAIYLALVFLSPISMALAPWENFQSMWLILYVPFGVAYGLYTWIKPSNMMMKIVTLTPLVFAIYVVTIYTIIAVVEAGVVAGVKLFAVVSIAAIPTATIIGSVYVLIAYGFYHIFKVKGWLESGS